MGKITVQEVEKLAKLARLGLSKEENEALAPQMSEILGFAEKLNEVNVEGVEPTSQVVGLVNVFRKDEIKGCDIAREELLKNAPQSKDGFIKVKAVLE